MREEVSAHAARLPHAAQLLVRGKFSEDVAPAGVYPGFDELDIVSLGSRRDLGYMMTAAALGAVGLHPSIRALHVRGPEIRRPLPTARATLLAISMLLPAALFIYGIDSPAVRAVPFQLGAIALAAIAAYRLLDSVRDQNIASDTLTWQAAQDGLTG